MLGDRISTARMKVGHILPRPRPDAANERDNEDIRLDDGIIGELDIGGPRTLALGAGVIVSALGALFVLVLISLSQTDW